MDMRNPERSLSWALMQAVELDLAGVESKVVNELLRTEAAPANRRPRRDECAVVLFTQSWLGSELGFDERRGGAECIEADTVVVTGPQGDACVYAAMQFLYRVARPNRRFFLELSAQRMCGKGEQQRYEGRDSEDEEAFDYEVASVLARVQGALRQLEADETERVVRMLRNCIDALTAKPEA